MKKFMILFLVAKDRPGIVDDLSTFLFKRHANIEDSRMADLGGRFSVMTLFSCAPERVETIKKDLDKLRKRGFEVSLHEAEDPAAVSKRPEVPLKLEVVAMDHPGIVQKVVHILNSHGINIYALNTKVLRAPLSGAPLFDLSLEAGVPPGVAIAGVKEELNRLAAKENLDLNFLR
jgi:glycine cleavage system transcriptional repressor